MMKTNIFSLFLMGIFLITWSCKAPSKPPASEPPEAIMETYVKLVNVPSICTQQYNPSPKAKKLGKDRYCAPEEGMPSEPVPCDEAKDMQVAINYWSKLLASKEPPLGKLSEIERMKKLGATTTNEMISIYTLCGDL